MENTRYLFKFFYIGTKKYFGSQRQPNHISIEQSLITALQEKKYIKNIKESGFEVASRTDRFVSARGSAFSFITEKKPILMEINSVLPKNLGIWAFSEVPLDFFSRFNAEYRHYKYITPYEKKLMNLKNMKEACNALEGKHDFKNFSKFGKEEEKTIRDLQLATLNIDDNFIIFDFKSRAFLRQQIRRMVAKILEVGLEIINLDDFLDLFDSSKTISYQPADPKGLVLWDVYFGSNIQFIIDIKSKERMYRYFNEKEKNHASKMRLFRLLQHNNIG
jgi:tRNA pseudouridine38-40 synthase